MSMPEISIVVPCLNEGEEIRKTISSILDTCGSLDVEIIVIDDASTEPVSDFPQNWPVRLFRQSIPARWHVCE